MNSSEHSIICSKMTVPFKSEMSAESEQWVWNGACFSLPFPPRHQSSSAHRLSLSGSEPGCRKKMPHLWVSWPGPKTPRITGIRKNSSIILYVPHPWLSCLHVSFLMEKAWKQMSTTESKHSLQLSLPGLLCGMSHDL